MGDGICVCVCVVKTIWKYTQHYTFIYSHFRMALLWFFFHITHKKLKNVEYVSNIMLIEEKSVFK